MNLDHLNIEDVEKILIRKALDKKFREYNAGCTGFGIDSLLHCIEDWRNMGCKPPVLPPKPPKGEWARI